MTVSSSFGSSALDSYPAGQRCVSPSSIFPDRSISQFVTLMSADNHNTLMGSIERHYVTSRPFWSKSVVLDAPILLEKPFPMKVLQPPTSKEELMNGWTEIAACSVLENDLRGKNILEKVSDVKTLSSSNTLSALARFMIDKDFLDESVESIRGCIDHYS